MLKRLINFVCSSSKSSSISTVILASSTREVPLITNSTDREREVERKIHSTLMKKGLNRLILEKAALNVL